MVTQTTTASFGSGGGRVGWTAGASERSRSHFDAGTVTGECSEGRRQSIVARTHGATAHGWRKSSYRVALDGGTAIPSAATAATAASTARELPPRERRCATLSTRGASDG